MVFAGGGEESTGSQFNCCFMRMGAFPTNRNDHPRESSRAYDSKRDGFVIAGAAHGRGGRNSSTPWPRGARFMPKWSAMGATSMADDMGLPRVVEGRPCAACQAGAGIRRWHV